MTLLTKNYKHRGHVHCWTRVLRIATCTSKQWVKTPALMFLLWNVASDYSLEKLIFERCLVWQVMPCSYLMPSTIWGSFMALPRWQHSRMLWNTFWRHLSYLTFCIEKKKQIDITLHPDFVFGHSRVCRQGLWCFGCLDMVLLCGKQALSMTRE